MDIDENPPSFADDWEVVRGITQTGVGTGTSNVSEVLADDALERAGLPKFAYSVTGGSYGLADLSVWRIQILKLAPPPGKGIHGRDPSVIIKYVEPVFTGGQARSPLYVASNGVTRDTFRAAIKNICLDRAAVEQAITKKAKAAIQSYQFSIANWQETIQTLEKDIVTYQARIVSTEAFEPSSVWGKDGG